MQQTEQNDYTFIDFDKSAKSSLGYKIRIYRKSNTVIFGKIIVDEVCHLPRICVRIRVDKLTGNIHLVFNAEQGLELDYDQFAKSKSVHNKDMAVWFFNTFAAESDILELNLSENLSNSPEYKTYKITKKK